MFNKRPIQKSIENERQNTINEGQNTNNEGQNTNNEGQNTNNEGQNTNNEGQNTVNEEQNKTSIDSNEEIKQDKSLESNIQNNNNLSSVKEINDNIEVTIYIDGTDDYLDFYDDEYWNIVQLKKPDIEILYSDEKTNNLQKGGESGDIKLDESLTGPYKYINYVFKNNPIYRFFQRKDKETEKKTNIETELYSYTGTQKEKYHYEHDTFPSIIDINPTKPKSQTPIDPSYERTKEELFYMKPVDDLTQPPITKSVTETNDDIVELKSTKTLILRFPLKKSPISLKKIMESRNPNIDIDITNSKFNYKEIERIQTIKQKKQLTDIYLEEIYYINGKLLIFKGILNKTTIDKTSIDLNDDILIFENTRLFASISST